jgi:hypothetical protein
LLAGNRRASRSFQNPGTQSRLELRIHDNVFMAARLKNLLDDGRKISAVRSCHILF